MTIKNKSSKSTLKKLEKITGRKLTVGNTLWSIRMCDELTQQQFSEKLGISKQYLCDLEKGRRYASVKAAAEYAQKLEQSETQFVRLCLQEMLDRDNIAMTIDVTPKRKPRKSDMLLSLA
jgi:transcriptional regulator with XRE-family HTH domain